MEKEEQVLEQNGQCRRKTRGGKITLSFERMCQEFIGKADPESLIVAMNALEVGQAVFVKEDVEASFCKYKGYKGVNREKML